MGIQARTAPKSGPSLVKLRPIIEQVKKLAVRFRKLTGKPLGVTAEVAEFEASRLMKLRLCAAREPGFDAYGTGRRRGLRIQIKSRVILPGASPGQRVPSIRLKYPWDVCWLVLLDESMNTTAIYEASRGAVRRALKKPGSKARNERGQLSLQKFKQISRKVWP